MRLTPAVARAFQELRGGEPILQYRNMKVRNYGRSVSLSYIYKIGDFIITRRTVDALLELKDWVDENGLTESGKCIYISPKGEPQHLTSSDAVDERYAEDLRVSQEKQLKEFVKRFPRYYLSPSIGVIWKCDNYEDFTSIMGGKLMCPKINEPLLEIPPPRDAEDEAKRLSKYTNINTQQAVKA